MDISANLLLPLCHCSGDFGMLLFVGCRGMLVIMCLLALGFTVFLFLGESCTVFSMIYCLLLGLFICF